MRASDTKPSAANRLEKITKDLCHLFCRSTTAVSLCTPAKYADLVCTRAKIHRGELNAGSPEERDRLLTRGVTKAGFKDSMYYI